MPFDPDKDKMLKQWKCEDTGLMISINQYGDGQPKLQIGPVWFRSCLLLLYPKRGILFLHKERGAPGAHPSRPPGTRTRSLPRLICGAMRRTQVEER